MFDYQVSFDQPHYLWLLLLLPALAWWGRNSLAAMGRWRRVAAFLLRSAVVVAVALALAEVNVVRRSDRVAVIYLLDSSLSISPEQSQAAIRFINESRAQRGSRRSEDLAGVIVFGREAAVELPPGDVDVPFERIEARINREATDLAGALRLARACFPHDCAKRVVVLSDGNETLESAAREAALMASAGIGIDVVPLKRARVGDVSVEKVSLPSDVRRGMPFDVKIVLNNSRSPQDADEAAARGRLRVARRAGERESIVIDEPIEVKPGKQVFSFREELASADFYTYDVRFLSAIGDAIAENNFATGYAHVSGNGRVLLVEDWAHAGEFDHLVARLRAAQIEVDVQGSNKLFSNLAELQRYDTVILANVPRTSGEDATDLAEFSDEQIDILVRNTQQMGGGLVMLGGPNSFGAGGWTNTALERAMPVDFQIKNLKATPVGALMLVIDRSSSMAGGKLEMSKAAAIAALRSLGGQDYFGVVAFDAAATTLVPMQRVRDGNRAANRISQLGPAGGTNMMPGMAEGYRALEKVDSGVKHMIVLTDGRTEGSGYHDLAAHMRKAGITTTSVAIGSDADSALMQAVARAGGGKFYRVERPTAIPRIFMKEAMRVSRPLVYESEAPFAPRAGTPHEMLAGVEHALPPITGFVMTTVKDSPLVEVPLNSPRPTSASAPALLAAWNYGLGHAVAWTTDAGQRWAKAWTDWEGYDKLFTQIVRWSMRPTGGDGKLNVFADARDGKLRVVVTALGSDDGFLDFLAMRAVVLDPEMKPVDLSLEQTAPGRYVGECRADKVGTYFVTVIPGQGLAAQRVGVNVGYSREFMDADANESLLEKMARQIPAQGTPGQVIGGLGAAALEEATTPVDVFRRDLTVASTRQPVWHFMVLAAACLFFCDVFNRRVMVSLAPAADLIGSLRTRWGKRALPVATPAIDRLRERKQEVQRQIDERRATARFEPIAEPAWVSAEVLRSEAVAETTEGPPGLAPEEPAESYTSRLLRAKRNVWEK